MAATRLNTSLFAAQGAGATSSAIDVSADYAREVYISIAQVGLATTGASFSFSYSADGTNYNYQSPTYTAPLTAGVTTNWTIQIPVGLKKMKMVYTAQSGGTSSSCTADLNEITGI